MRRELSDLYERHFRQLPPADRLSLLAAIAHDLALTSDDDGEKQHRLLELEGLGAEI